MADITRALLESFGFLFCVVVSPRHGDVLMLDVIQFNAKSYGVEVNVLFLIIYSHIHSSPIDTLAILFDNDNHCTKWKWKTNMAGPEADAMELVRKEFQNCGALLFLGGVSPWSVKLKNKVKLSSADN